MDERLERQKTVLIKAAYYALLLGIYVVFFKYIIYHIMPFFIAVLIAFMLSGPATRLARRLHIPRRGIAAVLVLIFFAAIGTLITFLVIRLIWAAGNGAERIPEWYSLYVQPFVEDVLGWYEGFAFNLNPELAGYIDDLSGEIINRGLEAANYITSFILRATRSVVMSVPSTLIGIIFCIIGSFFMTMDFPQISHFLLAQLNDDGRVIAEKTREYLVNGIGKILGSYAKIIGISFAELLIGLSIIGIRPFGNTIKWAFVIALFDILPVVGIGTVLAPWGVIEMILGNYLMGAEILILYLVTYIVRQIMEPRIVGKNIGVSPILMLISIFVGVTVFGPLGLITMPFTLIVVKNLNDTGHIHLFQSDYLKDEKAYVRAGGAFAMTAEQRASGSVPSGGAEGRHAVSLDREDPEDED